MNPDGSPKEGVIVEVNPGEVQGRTAANGMARLSINTDESPAPLTVTVSLDNSSNFYLCIDIFSFSTFSKCRLLVNIGLSTDQTHNHLTGATCQAV